MPIAILFVSIMATDWNPPLHASSFIYSIRHRKARGFDKIFGFSTSS
jgi:hypothetical protein